MKLYKFPLLTFISVYCVLRSYSVSGFSMDDSRLKTIEQLIAQQAELLSTQTENIRKLEHTILGQKTRIGVLEKQVSTLESIQVKNQAEISLLKKIISGNESKEAEKNYYSYSQNYTKNGMGEFQGFKKEINGNILVAPDLENVRTSKRLINQQPNPVPNNVVAFYAYLNHPETTPGPHRTLMFDIVKINLQSGYSPYTGAFTVPVDGVYVFTYTIRIMCHSAISFEIVKNNNPEGSVFIESENTNICDGVHATGTIITQASKGDAVYVRTHSTLITRGSIQSNEHGRSSFAGWLISNTVQ